MSRLRETCRNPRFFLAALILLSFFGVGCQKIKQEEISIAEILPGESWEEIDRECRKQDADFAAQRGKDRILLYQRKILDEPDKAAWYFLYGRLLGLLGQTHDSFRLFQLALQTDNESPWGYYGLGLYAWKKKDFREANMYFERCLSYESTFVPALVGLAKIVVEKNHLQAIQYLQQALKIIPSDASLHQHLGNIYLFYAKKPEKAERSFLRAYALAPTDTSILKDLALFYWQEKRRSEALSFLTALIQLLPEGVQKQKNPGPAAKDRGGIE